MTLKQKIIIEIPGEFSSKFQKLQALDTLQQLLLMWVEFYNTTHSKNKISNPEMSEERG
jgi:hypothetical protein